MSAWFARVGLSFTAAEEAAIGAWLRAAIPQARIAIDAVVSWPDAARFLRLTEHDATWWDHEEAEREVLWARAAEQRSESELLRCLDAAALDVATDIREAAHARTAAAGLTDLAVARAASDMALMAAHQCALAQMAGAGAGHPFVRKHALFVGGRWPLGYHSARLAIF